MRIDDSGRNSVAGGEFLQLPGYSSGGDTLAKFVQENEARILMLSFQPDGGTFLQGLGNVNSAQFATFGAEVKIAQLNVLNLDLNQFADSCSCGGKKANDKIPEFLFVSFKAGLEVGVVCFADDIFKKSFLLNLDEGQFKL